MIIDNLTCLDPHMTPIIDNFLSQDLGFVLLFIAKAGKIIL